MEVGNIDFEMQPNEGNNTLCFLLFYNLTSARITGTNCPISMGFYVKCSFANGVYNQVDKLKLNLIDLRLISLDHITNHARCSKRKKMKGGWGVKKNHAQL